MNDRVPILCLGSGAALNDGRLWNSLLIDGRILLDLPPTAIPQMHRLGVDPTAIETIFISHHHADHSFGLPFLLLEYCVRYERSSPLRVVGPPRIEELTERACELAWPHMREKGLRPNVPIEYIEIAEEGEHRAGDLSFIAVSMQHFGLDALGYRFEVEGRTIAYTGDTGDCAQLSHLLDRADVAIIELTHAHPSEDPGHLDVEQVERITRDLRARGTVVLATHLGSTPAPIEGITFCEDGKTYYV